MQTTKLHQAIGILGGTFDPIHFGHLRLGIELYEAFRLACVHIIPCHLPVHRKLPSASAPQRLAMIECAIQNEPAFLADPREIMRQGPSYAIDTLLSLKAEMPITPLCLMVGIDAFLSFPSWHRWQEILGLAHVIVAHRPQYQLPTTGILAELLQTRAEQEVAFVHQQMAGGIFFQPITPLEISATDIRKQIAIGKNPRYLLPEPVYGYIQQHRIYRVR